MLRIVLLVVAAFFFVLAICGLEGWFGVAHVMTFQVAGLLCFVLAELASLSAVLRRAP